MFLLTACLIKSSMFATDKRLTPGKKDHRRAEFRKIVNERSPFLKRKLIRIIAIFGMRVAMDTFQVAASRHVPTTTTGFLSRRETAGDEKARLWNDGRIVAGLKLPLRRNIIGNPDNQ